MRLLLWAALLWCLFPAQQVPASPMRAESRGERVLFFDSRAALAADGVMRVTETITVRAEGREIKRGLQRELPLMWNRADNKQFALTYTVLGVTRDGRAEPYTENRGREELRLRIGSSDTLLAPGVHEYEISYTISNHFSRFPDWDELYWNVTGNAWRLPIEKARFSLTLPPGPEGGETPFKSIDVYTGVRGEKGSAAAILPDKSVVTTAPLWPGQGLTVAYTWPRGVLSQASAPVEYNLAKKILLPSYATLPLFLAPLSVFFYFIYAWWRMRHKGATPQVIPLFVPPPDLSPGQLHYVMKGGYASDAFAADILRLAAKGAIQLDSAEKKAPLLKKQETPIARPADTQPLTTVEKQVMRKLFPAGKDVVSLGTARQSAVTATRNFLQNKCAKERDLLFTRYGSALAKGKILFFILSLAIGAFYSLEAAFVLTFLIGIITLIAGAFLSQLRKFFTRRFQGVADFLSLFVGLGILYVFAAGILPAAAGALITAWRSVFVPDGYGGAFILGILCIIVFSLVAPRRTSMGLARLAVAKGLVMYMSTAERRRFEALYPPEESVEHFEALFPYALALGVGKTWAATFARYLQKAGLDPAEHTMSSWSHMRGFRYACATAASNASRSSGGGGGGRSYSGSGSSRGGSSGGGSGGGGGGGW